MRAPALRAFIPALLFAFAVGCGNKEGGDKPTASTNVNVSQLSELKITDSVPGSGPAARKGDTVYVLYKGTIRDGKVFDESKKNGNKPFAVVVGEGRVIKGWDEGLVGVKKGAKRRLEIPAKLGYGEQATGDVIGPNYDLFFDIDCLYVLRPEDADLVDVKEIKKGTGAVVKEGSTVTVNYKGTLLSDVEFDSSKPGKPYTFTVGKKQVVPGFEAGVVGMKVGGKRRIFVPPSVGLPYGSDTIPANNPLIFEVELLSVK